MFYNTNIKIGDTVKFAMKVDMASPMYKHLQVWKESQAMDPSRYFLLQEGPGVHLNVNTLEYDLKGISYLLFRDDDAIQEFNEWWTCYTARFRGRHEEQQLPMPTSDQHISGYMFAHQSEQTPIIHVPKPSQFFDEWVWIVGNCTSHVCWTITHWIFESDQDAIIFKLNMR